MGCIPSEITVPRILFSSKTMRWCWHKWGMWEFVKSGRILEEEGDYIPIGIYEIQRRVCEKCGKSQLRRAEGI